MQLSVDHPLVRDTTGGIPSTAQSAYIRAAQGEAVPHVPVWFMRQAGRSLPEYRARRLDTDMLAACLTPELVIELTMQPMRRHGVDAAILFSDIVVPLRLMGVPITITPGRGPTCPRGYDDAASIAELTAMDPATLDDTVAPITAAVAGLTAELGPLPLIGFAGAPFTLAAYLVQGGPSKDHLTARTLMRRDSGAWRALLRWLAEVSGRFMAAQVAAGASAVQVFDSWAGALGRDTYVEHVLPHTAATFAPVRALRAPNGQPAGVPLVHFGLGTEPLLPAIARLDLDMIGVDYRTPLDAAARVCGPHRSLQGNLDPALLGADWPTIAGAVQDILARGRMARGHVFNLGHGVPPDTDPTVLTRIVDLVHEASVV